MLITETKYYKIEEPVELDCGVSLDDITVAYETYGQLNEAKDNVIFVFHALTGDAHAAGQIQAGTDIAHAAGMMLSPAHSGCDAEQNSNHRQDDQGC